MTWWVRIEVSWGTSATAALSVSAGTAWNAASAGASTVTSCWLLSESPRLAAVTAWTSVVSRGLLAAAVATGAVAMPAKLSAGICAQPAPKGWSEAALVVGAAELVAAEVPEPEALPEPSSDVQAVSAAVRTAATRATGPRVRFTVVCSSCVRRLGADGSADQQLQRVPAAGAVGVRIDAVLGLQPPGAVGGADGDPVRAALEVDRQHPLPPDVGLGLRRELRLLPLAAVHLDLDLRDAAALRPGDAGDGAAAGLERPERGRGVDPRRRLDRALGRPAALHPVGVEGVEGARLDAGQPLAGGDVAVEAGDDHPDGEAVLDGQGLGVHAERQHRVRRLERGAGGGADRHAVGGAADQLRRARPDAVLAQEVAQRHADPAGGAGQVSAHLVGDAGEGDVAFDEVTAVEEVLERVAAGRAEHAGQREPVLRRPQLRHGDGRVDPVEVAVGGEEGAEPLDLRGEIGALRQPRRGRGGLGEADLATGVRDVEAPAQQLTAPGGHRG